MRFLHARQTAYHTNPKLIDEVIYTTYVYESPPPGPGDGQRTRTKSKLPSHHATGDLLGIPELHAGEGENSNNSRSKMKGKFDTSLTEAEIFLFNYGTVVIWGMTESQEKRFLSSMYSSRCLYLDSNN
jgi:uncharacterized Rmd1/YagE family protein